MSDELKPCPFCGRKAKRFAGIAIPPEDRYAHCSEGLTIKHPCQNNSIMTVEQWNTRPLEDALRASLAASQDEVENLKEYIKRVGDIRAGLSREVEAQIILDARKPLEAEVERLRAQLESAKTWMPEWAIEAIEAFGVTK
jgi:hypothetical protein